MALVEINPTYRDFLARQGLADARELLNLRGVIICGHPDRHVLQLTLGADRDAVPCFLKREHRVSWRQRLANAWAGFGFISQSRREARLLAELRQAGVGCPEWIAAGEDDAGQAFLLLRAVGDSVDLRTFLQQRPRAGAAERRALAAQLGATLAHLHDAGFCHHDLYAKHVLVEPRKARFHILDWQRSRRAPELDWPRRWRDLAALHATLPDELAGARERLTCLAAYLRATCPGRAPREFRRQTLAAVEQQARVLLRQRKTREQRLTALPIGSQQLIWLDGEALCVTPEFEAAVAGNIPDWLTRPLADASRNCLAHTTLTIPQVGLATFVQRRRTDFVDWLRSRLKRKPPVSSELRLLGLIFRLQRHGIFTPRVLAYGQRVSGPAQVESFLLTAPTAATGPLTPWLATADDSQHRAVLRAAGAFLRRLHDAACYFAPRWEAGEQLGVHQGPRHQLDVVVVHPAGVQSVRRPNARLAQADLQALAQVLLRRRSDAVRLARSYCAGGDARKCLQTLLTARRRAGR